jgi:hypothetical protein
MLPVCGDIMKFIKYGDRPPLKFPEPGDGYAAHWERRWNRKTHRMERLHVRAKSYWQCWNEFLVSWAFSEFLAQQRAAKSAGVDWVKPSIEEVQEWMYALVLDKGHFGSRHLIHDEHESLHRLISGTAHSQGAAECALENFDPEFLERCAAGGRKSRPKRKFTPADLSTRIKKGNWALSKSVEAKRLNASTATIAILRRIVENAIALKDSRAAQHHTPEGFGADLLAVLDGHDVAPIKTREIRDEWHPSRPLEAVAS